MMTTTTTTTKTTKTTKTTTMTAEEEEECFSAKQNILHLITCGASAEAIVVELLKIQHCTDDAQLQDVRAAHMNKLGADLVTKLENVQPLTNDEAKAVACTVNHYRKWTLDSVTGALSLQYRIKEYVRKFVTVFGI